MAAEDLGLVAEHIENHVAAFNLTGQAPFALSLSLGDDLYVRSSGLTSDDFLKRVDHIMYENKQATKRRNTSKAALV